jgi:hypothetical protein
MVPSLKFDDIRSPLIFSVTGTVCGELVAPGAVTVMLPEYVPAPRPVIFACAFVVEGAVPEVLASERNDPVVLAVQLTVPPP